MTKKSKTNKTSMGQILAAVKNMTSGGSSKKKKGGKNTKKGKRARASLSAISKGIGSGQIGVAVRVSKPETYFNFERAPPINGMPGLRISCCVAAYNVGTPSTSASPNGGALVDVAGSSHSSVTMDPTISTVYLFAGLPLVTFAFNRYVVKKLVHHYRQNQGLTNVAAPFIFGSVDDPQHPAMASPTLAKFLGLAVNREFNAWEDWDMESPVFQREPSYSYSSGTDPADYRQSTPGAYGILQNFSSTVAVNYGVLYQTWVVDLYDFSPVGKTVSLDDPSIIADKLVSPADAYVARLRRQALDSRIERMFDDEKTEDRKSTVESIGTGTDPGYFQVSHPSNPTVVKRLN